MSDFDDNDVFVFDVEDAKKMATSINGALFISVVVPPEGQGEPCQYVRVLNNDDDRREGDKDRGYPPWYDLLKLPAMFAFYVDDMVYALQTHYKKEFIGEQEETTVA